MIIGIVAAKENSGRFPGKNIHLLKNIPLFWHSVQPLLDAKKIDKVYVATDSSYIKKYCEFAEVPVIWRHINASRSDDKLINIFRFVYYSIKEQPDIVVRIMANCPGHTGEMVDNAIDIFQDGNFKELRSFNGQGEESGLVVYSKEVMETNEDVSYYLGCVVDDVHEIHFKEDLNE